MSQTQTEVNLEEVLYQFSRLYDRWTLEQQQIGKREAEMIQAVESFDEQIRAFGELEEKLRRDIQVSVSKAAIVATDVIKNQVNQAFSSEMENFSRQWQCLTETLSKQIKANKQEQGEERVMSLSVVCVLAFVVGMFLMYCIMR